MAIPDFPSIMLPLLKLAATQGEVSTGDAYDAMVSHFHVSMADQDQPMPSGRGKTFRNRVAWAKQYLGWATLIVSVRRGAFRATDLGRTEASSGN
jgi:restriction system protein